MTDAELLAEWQSSPEGMAYRTIYDLENIVDDMTEAAKTRRGVQMLRADYARLLAAKRKLDDLFFELGPFVAE